MEELNCHVAVPLQHIKAMEACDIKPACQTVLRNYQYCVRPSHIRNDYLDRIPMDLFLQMNKMLPHPKDHILAKRHAYKRIREEVMSRYVRDPEEFQTSSCVLHPGKSCRLFEHEVPVDGDEALFANPLEFHTAGIVCKAVSRVGSREGDGHASMFPQAVWLAERIHRQEQVVFLECTEDVNYEYIASAMAHSHVCLEMDLNASWIDCVSRPRKNAVLMRKDDVILCEDLSQFKQFIGVDVQLGIDSLYCATKSEMADELNDLANHRVVPVDFAEEPTWEAVYSPMHVHHLHGYTRLREKAIADGRYGADAENVFDLEQNPAKRPRISVVDVPSSGFKMQCFTSHGTLHHTGRRRPLSTGEWFGGCCTPVLQSMGSLHGMPVDIMALCQNRIVSYAEAKSMAGNGWHLASQGSLLWFLLSAIELQGDHLIVPRPFASGHADGQYAQAASLALLAEQPDDMEVPSTQPDQEIEAALRKSVEPVSALCQWQDYYGQSQRSTADDVFHSVDETSVLPCVIPLDDSDSQNSQGR